MAQRSAHFTRQGEVPEQPGEDSAPIFVTCVLGLGGIRLPSTDRG